MQTELLIIAIIGLLLSLYAFYVDNKNKKKHYKAACDISKTVSCTKAFSSKYGKTFGISNSIAGILFYLVILLLIAINNIQIIFYLAILSVLGSIYLAYVSYFKIKVFCLVCNAIYVVNILLLIFSYKF